MLRFALLWLAVWCGACSRFGQADDATALLLRGGRVVTMTDVGTLEADLLIGDGTIMAVGKDLEADQVRTIDISGMTVTPGWIDARSRLWVTARAAAEGAADGGLDILDGVDLFSEDWHAVARQGVTTVYIQPSATGNLSGPGAVVRVAPAKSLDELVIRASAGIQAAIGGGSRSQTSRQRFMQFERIKKALEAAKKYGAEWEKYEKYQQAKKEAEEKDQDTDNKKAGQNVGGVDADKKDTDKDDKKKQDVGKREGDTAQPAHKRAATTADQKKDEVADNGDKRNEKAPAKPKRDPAKEQLLKVLRGDTPLRLQAHRQDEIGYALQLADEFQLELVLDGVSLPGSALASLQARRIPLIVGPAVVHNLAAESHPGVGVSGIALLTHDPRWALATFATQGRGSRMLRAYAAFAVAHGIDPSDVLRAVTIDAAALLGVADERGTIAVGRIADLAVFAGDPLDPAAAVRMTISQGQITYEAETQLRESNVGVPRDVPPRLPAHYAIRSQRVLRSDGQLEPATIVVARGQIVSVSAEARADAVLTIDVGDAVITPGLFLARSAAGSVATDDIAEAAIPEILAADAYHPSPPRIRKLVQGGILRLGITPGLRNVIAGRVALGRLAAESSIVDRQAAMQIVLTSDARILERYPASLSGQAELVRRWVGSGQVETSLFLPDILKQRLLDKRRTALAAIRAGDMPAWIAAETRAELRLALRLARELELKTVLVEPRELEILLESDVTEMIGMIARPFAANDYDRQRRLFVKVAQRGVPIAFAGNDADAIRLTASMAVAEGWPARQALRALTTGGLAAAGFDARDSQLQADTSADFVIWNGSPLDLQRRPEIVIVDGQVIYSSRR